MSSDTVKTSKFESVQWQAMIESIVEFIAASRNMLHVLNQRIQLEEEIKEKKQNEVYNECLKIDDVDQIHFNENYDKIEQKSNIKSDAATAQFKSRSVWDIAAKEISKQNKMRCNRSITPPGQCSSKPKVFSKDGSFTEGLNNQRKRGYIGIYQKKKSATKELGKLENV